jgi:chemotaxis protein methyltransferase CheR
MLDKARPIQGGAGALVRARPPGLALALLVNSSERPHASAGGALATARKSHRTNDATPACREVLELAFTFFFRDQQVLERVVEHSLPGLSGRSHPRIWDAGVAMGQEPYTLSIMFAERMGHFAFKNLRIDATDVESTGQFARMIEAAQYPKEELERLPEGILDKYFEPNGKPGCFRVIDSIRRPVAFQRHDLLSFQEIGHGYSLVLCKNVLLHFQLPERIEVLRMFHRALAPGGLFATEQTQEMPPELASLFQRVIPDGPLFRKVGGIECGS